MTFVQEDTLSKTLCRFSGRGTGDWVVVVGGLVRGEVVEAVRYGKVG